MKKDDKKAKLAFGAVVNVVDTEGALTLAIQQLDQKVRAHVANNGNVGDKLSRAAAGLQYTVNAAIKDATAPKQNNDGMSDYEWLARNPDHLFGPNFGTPARK